MAKTGLPLEGIRVADFSWIIVGPYCTQLLALMGAEVIRIESGQRMDIERRLPPFSDGIVGYNRSGLFNSLNMSKLSCTLDLRKPVAVELAKRIVKISDIVVEQFRHGMMEEFGLGYEALRQAKPDIIVVSSSGLGREGPECTFSAYNESFLAYSGLASMTGYQCGPPALTGGVWADNETGTNLTLAVLAAVYHRSRTGEGQFIDMSMAESLVAQIPEAVMDYSMNRRIAGRIGNRDVAMCPHGCYPCAGDDQWVGIAVPSEREWAAFCKALGHPEWEGDQRFSDLACRKKNENELDELIADWTKNHTKFQITAILQDAGVPSGPNLDIPEIVHDRHLAERGFFVASEHAETGRRIHPGVPWKLGDNKPNIGPAPMLGEHNEYVFCKLLGLSDSEFAGLVSEGVIA